MKVAEVMTRQIITILPDASILDAMESMLEHNISGLPVVDTDGKLVGVVTESDFLRNGLGGVAPKRHRMIELLFRPDQAASDPARLHARKVKDVMTVNLITVAPDTPIEDAVALMRKNDIKRLLVLRDGHLAGVISRADLMAACVRAVRDASAADRTTERKRAEIANMERELWMHRIRPGRSSGLGSFS